LIDLEGLLAPVSDEAPAGPDLSYDPDFLALEQAARGRSEQQFGDKVIPAEEGDWADVKARAEALLARSKDLRVAVLLARALTRLNHIEGLSAGLDLINGMLSRYWDSMHPELDHDDADDPTMRLNALAPLADAETLLREVRNASLAASPRHGRVTIRDVLVAAGKLPPAGGEPLSETEIAGIVRAVAAESPDSLRAALSAAKAVGALEALLNEKGVLTQAPELGPLSDLLRAVTPLCNTVLAATGATPAQVDAAGTAASAPSAQVAAMPGQIQSRDDAIRLLDNVCTFIEHSEPSNPAPLLIRRAQRLIGLSFVEIIEELAPESLEQIQKLGGGEPKAV
jgi:type VI secretion system protein ImpA